MGQIELGKKYLEEEIQKKWKEGKGGR